MKTWESCHYLSSNIFRKEERDWKMVYLARLEDTALATIAWNFDFTEEKLIIDSVSVKFETKTYENGVIDLQILNEHGKAFQQTAFKQSRSDKQKILSFLSLKGTQFNQWTNSMVNQSFRLTWR